MKHTIQNNLYMLRRIYKACPSQIFWTFLHAAAAAVIGIYTAVFLGSMAEVLFCARSEFDILKNIGIYALFQVFYSILNAYLTQIIFPRNIQILQKEIRSEIFSVVSQIDLIDFEDSEFYNKYYMAIQQSDSRADAVLSSTAQLFSGFFGIGALLSYITAIDVLPGILIFVSAVLHSYTIVVLTGIRKDTILQSTPQIRANEYIQRVFMKYAFAKDIRSYAGLSSMLLGTYRNTIAEIQKIIVKQGSKQSKIMIFQNLNAIIAYAVIAVYFSLSVLHGHSSVGTFITVMAAIQHLFQQTQHFVGIMPRFYEHSVYIDLYRSFIANANAKSRKEGLVHFPKHPNFVLDQVSFKYPNSSANILDKVSLSIPFGATVGIVGENGTGKSTLLKLLMGLYAPTEGNVQVNGMDLSGYQSISIRNSINIVFQDHIIYDTTIAENILMAPYDSNDAETKRNIETALKNVGLFEKVIALPMGIETVLSKEFLSNGQLMSSGECQRIALARISVKPSAVSILDEPTSSLDSISQSSIR